MHKGQVHAGQHPAIVDEETWRAVESQLSQNAQVHAVRSDAAEPSLLAGLLFDDQGQRLHPTHATKRGKRYRYYYARAVAERVSGAGDDVARQVLRIPAPELEQAVIGALRALLLDERRLLTLMEGVDAAIARRRIEAARCLSDRLGDTSADQRLVMLKTLIDRVGVHGDRLELSVRRASLWGVEAATDDVPVLQVVPMTLKRCGGAVRLLVRGPEQNLPRQRDARLIALPAKAHRWFAALSSGQHSSVLSLAQEHRIASSDATNVIYLAFMAPDLVQRIVDGDHPPWLGTKRLLAMAPLPTDWREQRRVLGMDASLPA